MYVGNGIEKEYSFPSREQACLYESNNTTVWRRIVVSDASDTVVHPRPVSVEMRLIVPSSCAWVSNKRLLKLWNTYCRNDAGYMAARLPDLDTSVDDSMIPVGRKLRSPATGTKVHQQVI